MKSQNKKVGAEQKTYLKKIMAKNFLNLERDLAIQVHEAHRLPNNLMRSSLGHIIVKLSKVNFFKTKNIIRCKKKSCNL